MTERQIKRMKIVTVCGCILILVLFTVQLYIETNFPSKNREFDNIRDQINRLQYENNKLEEQIYDASSYRMISSRAAELGFVEPNKDTFILVRR